MSQRVKTERKIKEKSLALIKGRGVQMGKFLHVSHSTLCVSECASSLLVAVYCLAMTSHLFTHLSVQRMALPMTPPTGEALHLQLTIILLM